MKMQLAETIDAGRDAVFARFADVDSWSESIEGITALDRMGEDGPLKVGSQFRETRVMFGKEATETFTVTQLTAPEVLTLRSESCGAEFVCRHDFEETADGRTRVTLDVRSKPLTLFAKVMSPMSVLMKGAMRKAMQKDLAEMKAACEAAPAAT